MGVYLVLFMVFTNSETGVLSWAYPDLATCEVAKIRGTLLADATLSKNTSVRGYHLDCVLTHAPKKAAT